jgi:seryl-tRNA synthetase
MLDRQLLRTQPEFVREAALRKGLRPPIDEFLAVDSEWRELRTALDEKRAEQNQISKTIGQLMGQKKFEEAEQAKAGVATLKQEISALEVRDRELEEKLADLELSFPNLPHATVPDGTSEEDNVVVRSWGEKPSYEFAPKPHWDLGDALHLWDLARGAKVAGSGFVAYTGAGARLQRALINFMIDHQTTQRGYREVYPPYLVNEASLIGTGQLPKFGEELYLTQDDLYLIPTAEVPVTNLYRDEILEADQLPIRMAAFSGCFRREAGAAGKDTRGIQRVHQFDKVELVKLVHPDHSYDELEALVEDAESVLQALGLHYRVVLLCGKEMSFGNAKCYDIELWAPGVERFLEVSSCSNFEAFQARRANIRFRPEAGAKPQFVHILNGSGVAVPRLFAAILEQFQTADGQVRLPEVLRPYFGGSEFLA